MSYSRKLIAPIVSAAVATISLTSFAIIILVRDEAGSGLALFQLIWPIVLTSAVAVILVMSLLYRTLTDLVLELQAREAAAQHLALHDQLTGLANRTLLQDRLDQALGRYRRAGEKVALLMLDLDRFKQVNDTLGHHAGDLLVQQVGNRLLKLLRTTDTVARIGGDEFALIQTGPKNEAEVRAMCGRVIKALREPFLLNGREARIGVSIGAILAAETQTTAADLLRKADITMYRAKAAGRDCFRFFSDEMDAAVQRRDQIESRLRAALRAGSDLGLYFQPQITSTGHVSGFEGLLRWTDPVLGELTPTEVIPIAEECGLINVLGELVLKRACAVARQWPDLSVAVNLSPMQFRNSDLPARLRKIVETERVQCSQIELEITETLLVEHGDSCAEVIQALRSNGFRIALDDFGTGYSSLSYLRRFQVDKIKLDRSFIDTAHMDESVAIIRAAVGLGHAINLEVMAEGIANKEQEQVALEAGCDGLQGFLYAPALPHEALAAFIEARRTSAIAA
ncbi:putative bifunctional diguanylate cyclase/phosphodiesterase [Sphingosinicella rhizophila]|uniref:EAL domain-containing protein n=1 Tax=Sphingosinicella rhizophila TaxID=3050082 RepID=A0ABU3Q439_9SPHN|nr:EAL domain-containing protein [Sphingosinicella sp. GR2756]MDT9598185.1 EAL domain-containing protein [Sphingosinicella sp. GR2756]